MEATKQFVAQTAIDYDMEEYEVDLIARRAKDSSEYYEELEDFIKQRARTDY